MAEEETDEVVEKKSKIKIIAPIGGVLLLAVAYFVFFAGGAEEADEAAVTTTIVVEGTVIEADQMTINLADEDPRYARLRFAVVLPLDGDGAAVGNRFPILKDAVLDVVNTYTSTDLKTPGILDTLRGELTAAAHEVWPDGEVIRVLITELLIQ